MQLLPTVILSKHLFRAAIKTPYTAVSSLSSRGLAFQHRYRSTNGSQGMELRKVVERLHEYASPSLAESWDNVGLLVEPSPPHVVSSVILTNDLTQEVLAEAVDRKVDMIISYHPPIFQPLKKLTQKTWKERILVKCMENRIAVYSPHTSYDVLLNGVTDWLIAAFEGKAKPITTASDASAQGNYSVKVTYPGGIPDNVESELTDSVSGVSINGCTSLKESAGRLDLTCTKRSLPQVVSFLQNSKQNSFEIVELVKPPLPGFGGGRLMTLDRPVTIEQAVGLIKSYLKLNFVRLAVGSGKTKESMIRSVAVCAGSGGSVLRGVRADLYLTGEMSHHEVLDAVQNGTTVVLCDHSNTERGFLTILSDTLTILFDKKVQIHVSSADRDPLEIV